MQVAMLVMAMMLAGCRDGRPTAPPAIPAVASVHLRTENLVLSVGESFPLVAVLRDAAGNELRGRTLGWTSSSSAVASVSVNGQVIGVSAGTATISVASEGRTATVSVRVDAGRDFAIIAAQFTQGVQSSDGSIPLVREGNPAVLNIVVHGNTSGGATMQVVLRLFGAGGAVLRTDTAVATVGTGVGGTLESPSAQILVPTALLNAGVRWQVVRDPKGLAPDATPENDVFPASGPALLNVVDVAPLDIRLVPIVLASHGDVVPLITPNDIAGYLRTVRSIAPIGRVNAIVGQPLVTSASFGVAPRGGESAFWLQVLAELEAARSAHPTESNYNWYGVVAPPPGFNFTSYGGFSYISSNAPGARIARTSVSVRTGWFTRASQARDLVAHELGHSFGRQHTACGGADLPLDGFYPVPGGTLDYAGHDVFAWGSGLASTATTIGSGTGDIMGYCFPAWSSAYTYRAIMAFRQRLLVVAEPLAAVAGARVHALEIRGTLDRSSGIAGVAVLAERVTIESTRAVELPAGAMQRASMFTGSSLGLYRAEGIARDGRVLFTQHFEPLEIDHAPLVRHFSVAIRTSAATENALASVRIVSPVGTVSVVSLGPVPERR